jgi:hypothetical protein
MTEITKSEKLPVRHCREVTVNYCVTTLHWCELYEYSFQTKQIESGDSGEGVTYSNLGRETLSVSPFRQMWG